MKMQKKKLENKMFIENFEKVLRISETIGHVLVQVYLYAPETPEKTLISHLGLTLNLCSQEVKAKAEL